MLVRQREKSERELNGKRECKNEEREGEGERRLSEVLLARVRKREGVS